MLYKIIPITPPSILKWIVKKDIHRFFSLIPEAITSSLWDVFMMVVIKDKSALAYIKTYLWHFRRRMLRQHI